MEQKYIYFAFISYSSHDQKWGKRVQNKLEHYRMPAILCRKHGWKRKPMDPVFFAPTDIQPGELTTELQEKLKASRYLIVVCSPHSARSEWVGKEIAFFHRLGRTQQIHFFIVEGIPHSCNNETECFNPIIDTLGLPEILGANIHEKIYRLPWLNKERAYVQLITKLLDVEFDSIWQRHKRLLVKKIVAWIAGLGVVLAALAFVWISNQPVDVQISLQERSVENKQLPPLHNAIVTLALDGEVKADTIQSLSDKANFLHIPHRYMNKKVRVTVECPDYLPADTTVILQNKTEINIYRDPTVYGNISFRLWDADREMYVCNCTVRIEDMETASNAEGLVSLTIPLERQRQKYKLSSSVPLKDEILFMPYGKDCVIRTK